MRRKNKEAEETKLREEHKKKIREARKVAPVLERRAPNKSIKPKFLIVCEGANTEPTYFNQFRLSSATIKSIGEGYNTLTLVKRAQELSLQDEYDQVWCVFDRDSFPEEDFTKAIILAEKLKFGVAYSNQSFEYWIILHLDDHQGGGMNRTSYNDKINKLLKPFNVIYDGNGNKKITVGIYNILNGYDESLSSKRVDLAIKRARRNLDTVTDVPPAQAESSTTVFRLVEELLKYV